MIINLHLGSGASPWVSILCLLQETSHIYWFHLSKTINQEKAKNPEMRSNWQQIISYCLGLCTQNQGLREVDFERKPKRGGDKISMQKQGRSTKESKSYRTAWTHIWIPALREVDLEPSAKRGTNRTRALVSLYWSSRSLHLKQSPNQIWHKSTKVDPIRLSQTCKKSNQIPKSYAFQHIKTIFPNTTMTTHVHDWGHMESESIIKYTRKMILF